MIATALRLHAELTAARHALTVANLAAMEAANYGDTVRARSWRARANGTRIKVGKLASQFRTARDNAIYQYGNKAAVALKGLE